MVPPAGRKQGKRQFAAWREAASSGGGRGGQRYHSMHVNTSHASTSHVSTAERSRALPLALSEHCSRPETELQRTPGFFMRSSAVVALPNRLTSSAYVPLIFDGREN